MLNLKELYKIAQAGGTLLQSKNYVGALMKYVACMMKSCQEILQIKATSDLINENSDNPTVKIKELISDTEKVFELARQCLSQSDAIVHSFFGQYSSPSQPHRPQQSRMTPLTRSASSMSSLSKSMPAHAPPTASASLNLSKTMRNFSINSPEFSPQEPPPSSPQGGCPQDPDTEQLPELLLLEGVRVSENDRHIIYEMGAQRIESINEPALLLQSQLSTLKAKIETAVSRERAVSQPNPSRIFALRSQFLRQNYELMNIAITQQKSRVNQVLSEYYAIHQAQEESAAAAAAEERAARIATEKAKASLSNATSKYNRHIDVFLQNTLREQTGKVPNVHKLGTAVINYTETLSREVCKTFKATENEVDGIFELCSDAIVSRTYDSIFPLFKKKNEMDDAKTNSRLQVLRGMITPDTVGAKRKFWLVPKEDEGKNVGEIMARSYAETVAAFTQIGLTKTLYGKFRCLKVAVDAVSAAVEKFYGTVTDDLAMGADDLLPILSFALFRSDLLNTHAEVDFMSELMNDRQSMGENGYNVATFMACVGFVDTITPQDLDNKQEAK